MKKNLYHIIIQEIKKPEVAFLNCYLFLLKYWSKQVFMFRQLRQESNIKSVNAGCLDEVASIVW